MDNILENIPSDDTQFPIVIDCATALPDPATWADTKIGELRQVLAKHPAVIFRNLVVDREGFGSFVRSLTTPVAYMYQSTPRTNLGERIYTATEYPASYQIPLHCENAYQSDWPMKVYFYCEQPAAEGGYTPLADMVAVTQSLREDIVETFRKKKIMYVRNYIPGVDLPWQTVFQTDDPCQVETYCQEHDIQYRWGEGDVLQTSQIRPALTEHPITKQLLWFNQAHLFHVSNIEKNTRNALCSLFKPDEMPRNAFYGDGSQIEEESLDHIRNTLDKHTRASPWKKNDLLVLDNMAVAHGRTPFRGKRSVLVMMGDPYTVIKQETITSTA